MNLRLVQPDARYSGSHASYVDEFIAAGEPLVPWILHGIEHDFDAYVKRLNNQLTEYDSARGFVANSSYWLLDDQEIVAVSNMRHYLTPALLDYGGHIGYSVRPSSRGCGLAKQVLRLTLDKLRALGVERARITCDKQNSASASVIIANGGVLDGEALIKDTMVQRYWIPMA